MKRIKRILCFLFGHRWRRMISIDPVGCYPLPVTMAKHCLRCRKMLIIIEHPIRRVPIHVENN